MVEVLPGDVLEGPEPNWQGNSVLRGCAHFLRAARKNDKLPYHMIRYLIHGQTQALGREGEGETERVLGFKMRRFGHSDDHPERITIRVDYRCSPKEEKPQQENGFDPRHGGEATEPNHARQ